MEVFITKFSECLYHLITVIGGLLICITAWITIIKFKKGIFFLPYWILAFLIFVGYHEGGIQVEKVYEYSNAIRQDIANSQDIIVVDKEILYKFHDKTVINDIEMLLLKENYKAVRENNQFVYFQKIKKDNG